MGRTVTRIMMVFPEPPSANVAWRHGRGRTYLNPDVRKFRLAVKAAYLHAYGAKVQFPKGTPVRLYIEWFRSRKSGDLDNRLKVTLDALRGLVFADDKQVVEIHAYRYDGNGGGNVSVTVESIV